MGSSLWLRRYQPSAGWNQLGLAGLTYLENLRHAFRFRFAEYRFGILTAHQSWARHEAKYLLHAQVLLTAETFCNTWVYMCLKLIMKLFTSIQRGYPLRIVLPETHHRVGVLLRFGRAHLYDHIMMSWILVTSCNPKNEPGRSFTQCRLRHETIASCELRGIVWSKFSSSADILSTSTKKLFSGY